MDIGIENIEEMTPRQRQVYVFIVEFIQKNKYSPTIREICKGIGVSSSSVAHAHVRNLIEKGYLSHNPDLARTITIVPFLESDVLVNDQI